MSKTIEAIVAANAMYDSRLSDGWFVSAAAINCTPYIKVGEVVGWIMNGWYGEQIWCEGRTDGLHEYTARRWNSRKPYTSSWPSVEMERGVWTRILVQYIEEHYPKMRPFLF